MAKVELLKIIENQAINANLEVAVMCDEFTCLCPYTEKPDFAVLTIIYVPSSKLFEMMSLKSYLASYSHRKILQEMAVSQICADIAHVIKPKSLTVKGEFSSRGGIRLMPSASYTACE